MCGMKKTDIQNLRKKSKEELTLDIAGNADKLWQVRNDILNGKVKNVREVRRIKKLIAVAKTILSENK